MFVYLLYWSGAHRDLHSFPTRRSSDLHQVAVPDHRRHRRMGPAGQRPDPRHQDREVEGLGEIRSEEHTSELQSRPHLVCRLLLEKKKKNKPTRATSAATIPSASRKLNV